MLAELAVETNEEGIAVKVCQRFNDARSSLNADFDRHGVALLATLAVLELRPYVASTDS